MIGQISKLLITVATKLNPIMFQAIKKLFAFKLSQSLTEIGDGGGQGTRAGPEAITPAVQRRFTPEGLERYQGGIERRLWER